VEEHVAYQRIMVPVDYSQFSKGAVEMAVEIARRFGSTIDVVHVWDRPSYVTDVIMVGHPGESQRSLLELIRENAERDMAEFMGTLELPTDVQVTHHLLSGDPAATLLKELGKGGHDLVVLGTHGRTGIVHLLLGSVAEKLIRHSPVPVLTVPPRERPKD
jgi:universal stress protein A